MKPRTTSALALSLSAGLATAQPLLLDDLAQVGAESSEALEHFGPDGSGGYYLSGYAIYNGLGGPWLGGADIVVLRVDAAGSLQWAGRYGTALADWVEGMDSLGGDGFYISGHSSAVLPNYDGFLMRFDPDGTLTWERHFGTTRLDHQVRVVARADGGATAIYSSTTDQISPTSWTSLIRTTRFDAAGNELDSAEYGAPAKGEAVNAAAAGPAGSIDVVGWSLGSFGGQTNAGGRDGYVMRLDSQGAVEWVRFIGGAEQDSANAVVSAPDGGVYVAGASGTTFAGWVSGTVWIARLAPDGTIVWKRDLAMQASYGEQGIAALPGGGFAIAGYTDQSLFGPNAGMNDFWVQVFGPDGADGPAIQFGTEQSEGEPMLHALADGRIVLAGGTSGSLGGSSAGGVDIALAWLSLPCHPDLTTGATPGTPGYGTPNGVLNNEDFFYYLAQFATGNLAVADLTTGSIPGQPGYGVPNGVLNNDDFFFYLALFAAGCA